MRLASFGWALCLCAGAAGCATFVGRYGPPFYQGPENRYFERIVAAAGNTAVADTGFSVFLGPDAQVRTTPDGPECLGYPEVFRFAWFSDVQIRQREVKLFGDELSRNLDKVIPNFEHNPMQDEFSWAAFLLQIQAVNRLVEREPARSPLFLIHTGDSIDSGSVQEAYQFQYIANLVRIPWFNVLGNHDTAIFGNYEKKLTFSQDAGVEFYPVGRKGFLGMHRPAAWSAFGTGLLPVSELANDSASITGKIRYVDGHLSAPVVPPTDCHGFDLLVEPTPAPGEACPGPATMGPTRVGPDRVASGCADAPGRWSFALERGGRKFRIVAVDTTKKAGWGADSGFGACDASWLRAVLAAATEPTILVFGHHRPNREMDQAVVASGKADRVVYFSGHTHSHAFAPASRARPYPELNGGSIIEFPQLARMVEVRAQGDRVCLVSRAMWTSYQGTRPEELRPDPSRTAELRQYLDEHCAPDPAAERVPLRAAARCSQYGAWLDFFAGRRAVYERPQPFDGFWQAANVAVALPTRLP